MVLNKHKEILMINDTELDEFYEDAEMSFGDVFAIVKGKMANKIPVSTAKEEFLEDVIEDAVDLFGYDFVFGK